MPNFRFSDEEANTLVQFFMASTNTGTFDSSPDIHENLADGQQLFTTFQCANCHFVGSKVPEGKTAAELAPNLTMASSRLRPEWILKWWRIRRSISPERGSGFLPRSRASHGSWRRSRKTKGVHPELPFQHRQGPQHRSLTPLSFAGPSHALNRTIRGAVRPPPLGQSRNCTAEDAEGAEDQNDLLDLSLRPPRSPR